MMNRCITCGKIVTRPKAQNSAEHKGCTYLVCCPLCEKEFHRDPAHYAEVARSLFGDYAVKAHSQASPEATPTAGPSGSASDFTHMIRSLKDSFDELVRSHKQLDRHLDEIATSGGLEGLRNALNDHRNLMDSLQERMLVHAGMCRFVLSVTESATSRPAEVVHSHEK